MSPVAGVPPGHGTWVLWSLPAVFISFGSSAGKVDGFQGVRDSQDYVAAEEESVLGISRQRGEV